MRISDNGIALIKKFEGLHTVNKDGSISAYLCPAGVWTIGYGHTKGVTANTKITRNKADEYLANDLNEVVSQVDKAVTVPLNQSQMDALVSFVFNLGIGNFRSSTLLKKLNKGDYSSVPKELMKWDKARVKGVLKALPGLTRRRSAEAALFAFEAPLGDVTPLPQAQIEAAPVKPLTRSTTMGGVILATIGTVGSIIDIGPILSDTAVKLQPYAETSKYIALACTALSVIGIALVTFSKLRSYYTEKS